MSQLSRNPTATGEIKIPGSRDPTPEQRPRYQATKNMETEQSAPKTPPKRRGYERTNSALEDLNQRSHVRVHSRMDSARSNPQLVNSYERRMQ